MATGMIKIFVIYCDDNQQVILKVVVNIKYTSKLLKILLKFALQNNFLSVILENNLKNTEIRKY